MRRLGAFVIAGAAAVASCTDSEPAPRAPVAPTAPERAPTPRAARPAPAAESPPAPSPLLLDGDLGDWTPAAADCEAAAALVEAANEGRFDEVLDAMPLADRVRTLRAGLRLADEHAARLAAAECRREWLDLWEQRRVAELLVAAAFDPSYRDADDEPVGLDDLYDFGGALDLAGVLRRLADVRREQVGHLALFGGLHKLLRADHVPALVALTRHGDVRVQRFAWEMLAQAMEHTDRFRAEIASVVPPDAEEIRVPADAEEAAVSDTTLANWQSRGRPAEPVAPRREEVERILTGADEEAAVQLLEYLGDLCATPGPWASARPEPWSAGLDRALLASDVSWRVLARSALTIPGCRTREVAEAVVARMPETCPVGWEDRNDDVLREHLAFLETAARDALVAKLRRWAAADPPSDVAALLLAELRDAESAPAVVALCERLRDQNWAKVPWSTLEGFRHPQVRAFLVSHFERAEGSYPPSVTMALEAVAVQDGFPERVGAWPWPGTRAEKEPIARLVLAGKPVDAFVATLAYAPDAPQAGEGRVDDPRVRAHLESIRNRRETGQHFVALAELVHADHGARLDLLVGIDEGRYRWAEDAATVVGPRFLTDEGLRHWTRALESNCCAAATAGSFLEQVFGWDPTGVARDRWTPASAFDAWWERHDGRVTFSRIADRWVPETR